MDQELITMFGKFLQGLLVRRTRGFSPLNGLTVSHEWVGWLGFYPADFAHNLHVLLFFKEKHVGQWDRDNSYTLVFDTIESDLVPIFVVHIVSL